MEGGRVPDWKGLYRTQGFDRLTQKLEPLIVAVKYTVVVLVPGTEWKHPDNALFGQAREAGVNGTDDDTVSRESVSRGKRIVVSFCVTQV